MPDLIMRDGKDVSLPDAHPINSLGPLRKLGILTTLCFSGFLANYSAATILIAFSPMAKDFGVSPSVIPNAIGYNLLGIAVGPIFWNAMSKSLGRRPTYLLGSALFIPCAIWMALSKSYGVFCAARVVAGLVSSFSQTVPPSTVADIFVRQVRGSKMSAFGVSVIIAPVVAPFICGLVVDKHSWRVVFWIVLGLAGLQLVMFYFLVPETLWIPEGDLKELPSSNDKSSLHENGEPQTISQEKTDEEQSRLHAQGTQDEENGRETAFPPVSQIITSLDARMHANGHCGVAWKPWQHPGRFFATVLAPIAMIRYLTLSITSIYYGMIFAWSVGITIVLPVTFAEAPYNFSTIALGSSFLALGLGAVLGKWSGGIVGDKIVLYMEKKKGRLQPEYRLHALLVLLPFMVAGLIICGVVIQKELHWIGFLIGGAIYYYCVSASTGILQTYVLECYLTRSMDTQAVFIFFKCIWGFAIAFFVVEWGQHETFLISFGIQAALAGGLGLLLWAALITKGLDIRRAQGMPMV